MFLLEQKVISCASSTLYCLAPIIKILEDKYGVVEGFITSIHAMTPSLKPLDGLCLKGKHWRDHRSIHQNIIPAATGACKALGKIIPSVRDKLTGLAFRVPIVNVSVLDITVRLNKNATIQNIIKCVEEESKSTMKNIIKIAKDQEVSSDFMGDEHSCIVDANSSLQLNPKFFKLICWYENEYSYACRVLDSIKYSEENIYKLTTSLIIPSIKSIKAIQNFNKEYIVSNCHISSNPKVMLSSQEIGFKTDLSPHTIGYEKPLEDPGFKQLLLRDSKENKDVFNARKNLKENKNSNFLRSVTLGETFIQNNNYLKTKERLEEVKKEFSKMANMTENLLKKSNQYKCEANFLGEELDSDEDKKDTKHELYSTRLSSTAVIKSIRTNEVLQKSISENEDVFKAHINEVSNTVIIKNNSEYSNTPNIYANGNQEAQNKMNNIFGNVRILENPRRVRQYKETSKITETVADFDDQENPKPENTVCILMKTSCNASLYNNKINLVTDSCAHKADLWNFDLCTKKTSNDDTRIEVMELKAKRNKLDDKSTITNTKKICTHNITKPEEIKQLNRIEDKLDVTSSDSHNEKLNNVFTKYEEVKNLSSPEDLPDVISSKIHKDKMKSSNDSDLNRTELTVTYINPKSSELENDVATLSVSRNEIRKKILGGIMKILTAKALENKTRTPSRVTTNTTISNREVFKSLDIYDKLDSASASDSENSFQINEKISQVIEVTDLSSSAEELARLDKICRIIEISDEMSDKLFSALNNNDNNTKKTKWSFKDLCERLKFDEFCNNVFGEPSS